MAPPASRVALSLTISMLAACSIPLPAGETSSSRLRPYLTAELHLDGGGARHRLQTGTHRGPDVDLAGEPKLAAAVSAVVPGLAFVRFAVRHDDLGRDPLAAWACVRLDRLGNGYRLVRLRDAAAAATDGLLLVKVDKTTVAETAI